MLGSWQLTTLTDQKPRHFTANSTNLDSQKHFSKQYSDINP